MKRQLGAGPVRPAADHALERPLALGSVTAGAGGWLGAWMERNRQATLPHCISSVGEQGAVANLQAVPGGGAEPYHGMWFADSDVYKTLEAAYWELGNDPGNRQAGDFTAAIGPIIAAAQLPDGYVNSYFSVAGRSRWSDFAEGHELYCLGHLLQAAVASGRAHPDEALLETARRAADHAVDQFGGEASEVVCGHPLIEMALVEFYRLTGEESYLTLARRMLERRGRGFLGTKPFGPEYFQDHVAPRDLTAVTGHAVRQFYLLSGMADVYLETGDATLLEACQRAWDDAYSAQAFVTGGFGARHRDESFGDRYELPPDRAYAETCAAIAAFQWNWRMLLATGDATFAAAMEWCLHNAIAAGMSHDGTTFFYANPLQLRSGHHGHGDAGTGERLAWFYCPCCPPNVARLYATLPGYLATVAGRRLTVQLYADARIDHGDGDDRISLGISTDIPDAGTVRVRLHEVGAGWTLRLRLPEWADGWQVHSATSGIELRRAGDYLEVGGCVAAGAEFVIEFPMRPALRWPHPRLDAARGTACVTYGPRVYCVEDADLPAGLSADDLGLRLGEPIEAAEPAAGFGTSLTLPLAQREAGEWPLYSPSPPQQTWHAVRARAIPYADWGNRSAQSMRVWLPILDQTHSKESPC